MSQTDAARQLAHKRRVERQREEWEQEGERLTLTKDNSKARTLRKKRKRVGGGGGVKKLAPGRKTRHLTRGNRKLKSAAAKRAKRIAERQKAVAAKVAGQLREGITVLARVSFIDYLHTRMLDEDVTAADWLDWIEAETDRLREELRREIPSLYPRE